jgi:hypothetical protein
MTATPAKKEATARLIDTIEDAEHTSLAAVRKFLETVNGVFPDLGEDGTRRQVIDSAFKMTEQLVGAANRLAQNILDVTEKTLSESDKKSAADPK